MNESEPRGSCEAPSVLFLTRSFERGGAERQLVALVTGLRGKGWDVSIACFYPNGPLQEAVEAAGIPVFDIGKKGRWDIFGFIWRLVRHVRMVRPDIIHGYLSVANLIALLLRPFSSGSKAVWSIRASNMDMRRYNRMSRVAFWLECRLARFTDLVIANSRAGKAHCVAHGFPGRKVAVIANGIDTTKFRFDPDARKTLRNSWGIDERSILVGLPARVDPMKDHATFLAAAAQLACEDDRWCFICIGDGTMTIDGTTVSANISGVLRNNLILAGPRDDMACVYSAIDIAVSSSVFGEGFSNAIAEAMACGSVCVVTDVGDSAEIVGDTGLVVPPGDPEALAQGIRRVRDSRAYMRKAAQERIAQEFSLSRLVTDTAAVLQSLYLSADPTRPGQR